MPKPATKTKSKPSAKKSTKTSTKTSKKPVAVEAPVELFRRREMKLTDRETDVLRLFARGNTYVQIADELGLSSKTVGSYLQRVREKARAKSRSDLITLAVKENLFGNKGSK